MSRLLEFILDENSTVDELKIKVNSGLSTIPLFEKCSRLQNLGLYEHLEKYQKIKIFTLEDLHNTGAINIEEKNNQGLTLLQMHIQSDNLNGVRQLLSLDALLSEQDFTLAQSDRMNAFFNYRPGKMQPSILEFCSKRHHVGYSGRVSALIYDEQNSTEEDSSEAEAIANESLNQAETVALELLRVISLDNYNKTPEIALDNSPLRLVAARGVHFTSTYFKKEAITQVKDTKQERHTTYSQSTLFDAGYTADDSPAEDDEKIIQRHIYNNNFIEQFKISADFKEKKIKGYTPPASRNNKQFENAHHRLMQVYISSYSTLFSKGSIKTDFQFDTLNNPFVSASWSLEKATMYGSGARMEQSKRRDPHYRQFTCKPKHPNMGYLDLFVFDIPYVKANGYDRALQFKAAKITLSDMYRHEAEIIFNSMIPKKFHELRCILSLPAFDKSFKQNKGYYHQYGIKSEKTFNELKKQLFISKKTAEYKTNITSISEKAAQGQASSIKKTLDFRLFKAEKPTVVVFDHGDKLESKLIKV